MGDRLGIRNVVDIIFFSFFLILYSRFNALHNLNPDRLLELLLSGCLIDQANTCLIHFYKRCVSITNRLLSVFSSGLKKAYYVKVWAIYIRFKPFNFLLIVSRLLDFFCLESYELILPEQGAWEICLRPYHVESTSSRPITEVKQHWVALVLGWVTAWEYAML